MSRPSPDFHVVHFRTHNPTTDTLESRGYEVYCRNRPYLRPPRAFGRLSRRVAYAIAALLNGSRRAS